MSILEKYKIPHCFDKEYFDGTIERAKRKKTINRFVDEIVIEGLDNAPNLEKIANNDGRILYASNHKSHIDYLVLGYVIATNKLPIPRFAAGENLLCWPVNKIINFRKMGAFSIDRQKNGNREYLKELYKYIGSLVKNKENMLFFPEGGRNYNNPEISIKRLPLEISGSETPNKTQRVSDDYRKPQTGLIRAVMDAADKNNIKVYVEPININYDIVAENGIFSSLKKVKFKGVWYYLLDAYALTKRYFSKEKGKIYIKFGSPIEIKELGKDKKEVAGNIMQLIKNLKNE